MASAAIKMTVKLSAVTVVGERGIDGET